MRPSPRNFVQPKLTRSAPKRPKASMSAATSNWLMSMALIATVGESAPMPSMTVSVMTRPSAPPSMQYQGAPPRA